MKFGVREICDVVLKAKAAQKVGNKVFYKNEPVCYFDTLKTSSLEGAATTVYAQGGKGNSRLVAWEGERTITFTMEDGEVVTEPYIPDTSIAPTPVKMVNKDWVATQEEEAEGYAITLKDSDDLDVFKSGCVVLVDFYVERTQGAQQIDITADKFGGNYYLEASTLFRNQDGVDMPAEFIIPNCKIQSNFTFTMASSGDPSSFTFTMDAFPDYTRFDKTKKVLAAIQIIETAGTADIERDRTASGQIKYFD